MRIELPRELDEDDNPIGPQEYAEAMVLVNADTGLPSGTEDSPTPVTIVGASGVTFEVNEADFANIGAKADAAATTDTGTFSLIAFIKRGMQNWTSLQAKLPVSLGSKTTAGSVSVTLSTDHAALPLPALAATAANQVTEISGLGAIVAKLLTAPATEEKQDTGNDSLVSILSKLIAAPATEAKQDDIIAAIAAGSSGSANKSYMVYGEAPAVVGEYSNVGLVALSGGTDGDMNITSVAIGCTADCYLVTQGDTDSGSGTTRNARETDSSAHGTFSIGRCYMGSVVTPTAPIVGRVCVGNTLAATYTFDQPYVLKDGEVQGLFIRCVEANTAVNVTFQFNMAP